MSRRREAESGPHRNVHSVVAPLVARQPALSRIEDMPTPPSLQVFIPSLHCMRLLPRLRPSPSRWRS